MRKLNHNKNLTKAEKVKAKRLKQSLAASTQNTLAYEALFEDGTMALPDNQYSRTYDIGTLNYDTETDDGKITIATHYNNALNLLGDTNAVQLTILHQKKSKKKYMEEVGYPLKGDELDLFREAYNKRFEKNFDRGRDNYYNHCYLTLTEQNDNPKDATYSLQNLSDAFFEEYRKTKAKTKELNAQERLELINTILRPKVPLRATVSEAKAFGLRTQNLVAPDYLNFTKDKRSFQIDDFFGSVYFLRQFPRNMSDGFFKGLTELDEEYVVAYHGRSYSAAKTMQLVHNELTDVNDSVRKAQQKAAQQHYSQALIPTKLKDNQKDLEDQAKFLKETGDKFFSSTLMIYVWADTREELKQKEKKVQRMGEKLLGQFAPLYLVQEEALNSILPLGHNYVDVEQSYTRMVKTTDLSIVTPYTTADVQHKDGVFYGTNLLTKNNILINREDRSMPNGNGAILAPSGGGKSVSAKDEILKTALAYPNDQIIVLDAEREYKALSSVLKGETIVIASGSKDSLNLFDLPNEDTLDADDDAVAIKSDFMIGLLSSILGNLTVSQVGLLDRLITQIYQKYETPTLHHLYDLLLEQQTEIATELAEALEIYTLGSMNMFSKETTANLDNKFIVFDLNQIQGKFKSFAYLAVLDRVWQQVASNREKGIRTHVYIDEFHTIISQAQPASLRAAASNIYARIRKYKGLPTFMTQSVETMLATEEGRIILHNCDFVILLRQKGSALRELVKEFSLTEEMAQTLISPEVGEGVIVAGNERLRFTNYFEADSPLMTLFNTKVA